MELNSLNKIKRSNVNFTIEYLNSISEKIDSKLKQFKTKIETLISKNLVNLQIDTVFIKNTFRKLLDEDIGELNYTKIKTNKLGLVEVNSNFALTIYNSYDDNNLGILKYDGELKKTLLDSNDIEGFVDGNKFEKLNINKFHPDVLISPIKDNDIENRHIKDNTIETIKIEDGTFNLDSFKLSNPDFTKTKLINIQDKAVKQNHLKRNSISYDVVENIFGNDFKFNWQHIENNSIGAMHMYPMTDHTVRTLFSVGSTYSLEYTKFFIGIHNHKFSSKFLKNGSVDLKHFDSKTQIYFNLLKHV